MTPVKGRAKQTLARRIMSPSGWGCREPALNSRMKPSAVKAGGTGEAPPFRAEWLTDITALSTLAVSAICILAVENLSLTSATKNILETLAIRAFVAWWIIAVMAAAIGVARYKASKPYFSMNYTSIGILIFVTAILLSAFLPDQYSNPLVYLAIAISLIMFFYDLLIAFTTSKSES